MPDSIEKQVKNMFRKMGNYEEYLDYGGMTYEEMILKEAGRLKDIIQWEIDNYYSSNPKEPGVGYRRTYNWKRSVHVATIVKNNKVDVYFDEWWNTSYEKLGFVPLLMDTGWKRPYAKASYAGYKGLHYIKTSIEKFNSNNPYKVKLQVRIAKDLDAQANAYYEGESFKYGNR